jgi:hypothetical protein
MPSPFSFPDARGLASALSILLPIRNGYLLMFVLFEGQFCCGTPFWATGRFCQFYPFVRGLRQRLFGVLKYRPFGFPEISKSSIAYV